MKNVAEQLTTVVYEHGNTVILVPFSEEKRGHYRNAQVWCDCGCYQQVSVSSIGKIVRCFSCGGDKLLINFPFFDDHDVLHGYIDVVYDKENKCCEKPSYVSMIVPEKFTPSLN